MFELNCCANGIITRGLDADSPLDYPSSRRRKSRRRKIQGFSPASVRRLRESLCRWVGEGTPYAFTFTFPFNLSGIEYRRRFERFRHQLAYHGYSMIWRVELTRHRRPHLHCVVYLPSIVSAFEVQRIWWGIVDAYAFEGGVFHSCIFQPLTGSLWWRYVAAHTSKQKCSQLGWRGRQWGFVNRSRMTDTLSLTLPSGSAFHRVLRVLRRLSCCRSSGRGHFGRATWFCSPDTVSRLVSWASS